jgi:hypothetical protein
MAASADSRTDHFHAVAASPQGPWGLTGNEALRGVRCAHRASTGPDDCSGLGLGHHDTELARTDADPTVASLDWFQVNRSSHRRCAAPRGDETPRSQF